MKNVHTYYSLSYIDALIMKANDFFTRAQMTYPVIIGICLHRVKFVHRAFLLLK